MSKLKYKGDLVHTEKFEKDGKEEKKFTKVGALFEREDGSLTIKLLGGWLNVYPPKAKAEDYRGLRNEIEKTRQQQKEEFEDEIPF